MDTACLLCDVGAVSGRWKEPHSHGELVRQRGLLRMPSPRDSSSTVASKQAGFLHGGSGLPWCRFQEEPDGIVSPGMTLPQTPCTINSTTFPVEEVSQVCLV